MNQPVTKPEDEPSMEEILASIRKIISDDDVKNAEDDVKAAEAQSVVAPQDPEDDILELTEMVDDAGNPIMEEIQTQPAEMIEEASTGEFQEVPQGEEGVDMTQEVLEAQNDVSYEQAEGITAEDTSYNMNAENTLDDEIDETPSEPLISEPSLHEAAAALGSLSRVASQAARPREPQMEGMPAQKTTEELVKEILKPLLKEWLDANLPSLVKWIVAEQVEKIVQQAAGYSNEPKEENQNKKLRALKKIYLKRVRILLFNLIGYNLFLACYS